MGEGRKRDEGTEKKVMKEERKEERQGGRKEGRKRGRKGGREGREEREERKKPPFHNHIAKIPKLSVTSADPPALHTFLLPPPQHPHTSSNTRLPSGLIVTKSFSRAQKITV